MSSTDKKTAETLFREAFKRLKLNRPRVLKKGSLITQNNVAREAGRDPSALKKDRYPILVLEIQEYVRSQTKKPKSKKHTTDRRNRSLKQKNIDLSNQRDTLASIVEAQDELIENLKDEIVRLKEDKVVLLK